MRIGQRIIHDGVEYEICFISRVAVSRREVGVFAGQNAIDTGIKIVPRGFRQIAKILVLTVEFAALFAGLMQRQFVLNSLIRPQQILRLDVN